MSKFIGYIYIVTDLKTNKIYIGRKIGDPNKSKNYYGSGRRIKDIIKSRNKTFLCKRIIGIINTCFEDLKIAEEICIEFYDACNPIYGYNFKKSDSDGSYGYKFYGRIFSLEHRKKLSESHKGKITWMCGKNHSKNTKDKLSKINKGKKLSQTTKNKMSKSRKGRQFSDEHKRKLSESAKIAWRNIKTPNCI